MSYATLDEFATLLGLQNPSTEALDRAQKCLDAATQEIDSHLGWDVTPPTELTAEQLALVALVNLDRASEHWRNVPFGALQQGPEFPSVLIARDSFYRHARKLASLDTQWGIG